MGEDPEGERGVPRLRAEFGATESPNRPGASSCSQGVMGNTNPSPGSPWLPIENGIQGLQEKSRPHPSALPGAASGHLQLPAGPAVPPCPRPWCAMIHQVTLPDNCRELFCPPGSGAVWISRCCHGRIFNKRMKETQAVLPSSRARQGKAVL